MKRAAKIALAAAGLVIGLPLFGVGSVIVAGNTEPGRHAIEQLVSLASGGRMKIDGLSGRFPEALRARRVAVSDQAGTWLTVDQARLDWSPLHLLYGELQVATFAATHVSVARLPKTGTTASTTRSGPVLPVSVAIKDLRVDRLDLAAPVAVTAASVTVKGDLHLNSLEQGSFALDVERLGSAGSYQLSGTMTPSAITGRLNASEPAHGPLAGIVGLPDLGPLSISASLSGPRTEERAQLSIAAGPLTADGRGTIDLATRILDVDVTGSAPAMAPRADLRWRSAGLDLHLHGSFASPNARGQLDVDGLSTGEFVIGQFKASVSGSNGKIDLTASLAGLRVPGPRPDVFAAAPFKLHADAILNTPTRPVTFTLSHPLVTASGQAELGAAPAGSVTVALPSLAPYAAVADVDLHGHAELAAKFTARRQATTVDVEGAIAVTGGLSTAAALIGDKAKLNLECLLHGQDIAIHKFTLDGKALHIAATGARNDGVTDLGWTANVSGLSSLSPAIAGTLATRGHLRGSPHDLAVVAQATADVATARSPKERLTLSLHAQGLPVAPSGRLDVQGRLAGAPLELVAAVNRQSDGTLEFLLDRLQWKSASGQGRLTLPPGTAVPSGHLQFRMTQLGNIASLTGVTAAGSISATFDTVQVQGKPQARLQAEMRNVTFEGDRVDRVTADVRIANPMAQPTVLAAIDLDGVQQDTVSGNIRLTANGPLKSLPLRISSDFQTPHGPAKLSVTGVADVFRQNLRLASLQATYGREAAHLLEPARINFANGVSVDRFRLGAGGAVMALAGRLTPTLAVTVSVRNVTPALATSFYPGLGGSGTLALDGQLHGTLAAPEGTVRLTARRLQITAPSVGGLPAADLNAMATFVQNAVRLNGRVSAGSTLQLRFAGTAPLRRTASVDLRLSGTVDLVALDPLLTPNGRAVHGRVTLDLGVTGTMAMPRATGTIRLARGSVEDFVQGIRITDLNGLLRADGTTLRIVQLTGHAGAGTVSIAGTIGIFEPGLPIALTMTADNAQVPDSDLLNATMSANLAVRGELQRNLSVGGRIQMSKANINIPDRFPESVAVLHVRRPGAKAPPPAPHREVMFDLTIAAPEQVFVRGHGIDAEMGGTLRIDGNSAAPMISGGFDLRHGTFSLAGQSLTFTKGKVAFGGTGLKNKLDPTIDLVAENTANGVTATLTITGYADAPKIQLSSSPDLPQDEILAHLLFGQSVKQLSPFQLAEIAQAIASLGGVGGSNPLATVRKGLGLDRLTVNSASGGGGTTAEAGKYVANGVYVGTKHNLSGGTQAQVQIDLTKRLKLESTLGTGGTPATGATPDNDPGSSVGLTYQFEY